MKRRQLKRIHITQLILTLVIIVLLNIVGSFLYSRIDLTQENRYSLSKDTREILRGLDDVVYIRVYLDGDLPLGFTRLRNSIKEILDDFRSYAPRNLQYEFIDPSAETDDRIRFPRKLSFPVL